MEETGYSCSHLKPCLEMHPSAARQQETGTLAQGCDVIQVICFTVKQDEQSMSCIALNVG